MKHRTPHARARPAGQPAAKRPDSHLVALIAGLLVMIGVVLLVVWLRPVQPASQSAEDTPRAQAPADPKWTVGMLRPDGLRIVVTGREDNSQVLDPQRFSRPEVRRGYWIATQIPALLNKLYCWCGCENRGIHRSNLQCFEDEMAMDCPVCLGTAEMAYQMSQKGITDAATIQAAVDVRWRPRR
ncbi:MAG: PCYCGC motif-containing (lipo)protein [Pseudomonadota bacterium]